MIQKIRTSKVSKFIATYLAIMILLEIVAPMKAYALTEGPSQPEFNSFTPIGTSDMVDLTSGDLNYNIPIMDVGGYPINLSYSSGVTMDQEASWVGLGWNLNVGQINRNIRGIPDDFKGDLIKYENNAKKNQTVGASIAIHPAVVGADIPLQLTFGLGVTYNNYTGFSYKITNGFSFQMSDNVSVGISMDNSSSEGVTVSPNVSLEGMNIPGIGLTNSSVGTTINSRQGLTGFTISASKNKVNASFGKSFLKTDFTPSKRVSYINKSFAFNSAIGFEIWGGEGQGELYAYASTQDIKDKTVDEKAYGYENTDFATKNDILDINRENDREVSRYVTTLPITNYTYDQYSIQGQGIGGSFRPHRGQVGYVFDSYTEDSSTDADFGVEIGPGAYFHGSGEFRYSPSTSYTGLWENNNAARASFITVPAAQTTNTDYEKVYFRPEGETDVDNEYSLYTAQLGGEEPIRLGLEGNSKNKKSIGGKYRKGTQEATTYTSAFVSNKVKRQNRITRNQAVQKINKTEFTNYYQTYTADNKPLINSAALAHHTTGIRVLQPDGGYYIFDQPVYNTKKVEATFNVTGCTKNLAKELVTYASGDNSASNNRGTDHYFNRVTTPGYAHTYLISQIQSPDYQDIDNNGPTENDLGSYTKFHYVQKNSNYKWRVPFEANTATLNDGLYSLEKDAMGNYVYGEKELIYIDKIETKTHVAIFTLSVKKDGYGVNGENGGLSTASKTYKIDKISLYTQPEYKLLQQYLADSDPTNNDLITPIKEANFVYDYSLMSGGTGVPNNNDAQPTSAELGHEFPTNQGGKLTLRKVYFTYRGSKMGKYTPYQFDYGDVDGIDDADDVNGTYNKPYDVKAYDIWGNYKPTAGTTMGMTGLPTTAEFPYVTQNKAAADVNSAMWTLRSILLPSGGKINMTYESDDYAYVQDKKAMQMFMIRGVGNNATLSSSEAFNTQLYGSGNGSDKRYLYIELPADPLPASTANPNPTAAQKSAEFRKNYLEAIKNDPLYFRSLLNMAGSKSDFVTGYLKIASQSGMYETSSTFQKSDGKWYASIPMQFLHIKTGNPENGGNDAVNPLSKAGWLYARTYLNRLAYGQSEYESFDVTAIVNMIINQLPDMMAIFQGPDRYLRNEKSCAKTFSGTKSWLRLLAPNGKKLGGGTRVKKVEVYDNWQVMTNNTSSPDVSRYTMKYGQEYNYEKKEGNKIISSGVAAFEPFGGKENPFVKPFEDQSYQRVLAPADHNYVEKPLGSFLFPSAKITYSRVEVKNITPDPIGTGTSQLTAKKHATGKVVNEFYTSKDFPTIAKNTLIEMDTYGLTNTFSLSAAMFNLKLKSEKAIAMSQGFAVITNDMDGKLKSKTIYAEFAANENDYITREEYNYKTDASGNLNSTIPVINEKGLVTEKTVGTDYEVVNDFRTSKSTLETYGADLNLALIPGFFGIPFPIFKNKPTTANHTEEMRMAVTTKAVHKTGILLEKRVFDKGAEVITTNLAWDASTGEVLLTEITNEFNDKYYSFNYPAYWKYKGMGKASKNLDMELTLSTPVSGQYTFTNAQQYVADGDEVWASGARAWIVETGVAGTNKFRLMKRDGTYLSSNVGKIKIIRSGYRNLQNSMMSSVTLMKNPIKTATGSLDNITNEDFSATTKIINASAIEYSDQWTAQCECDMPAMVFNGQGVLVTTGYNPYANNIKGNWRAIKSYAYLTGRTGVSGSTVNPSPRSSGYFTKFSPYYSLNAQLGWDTTPTGWTFASQVSQFSPSGNEIENVDALERYSAAQYGFTNNIATAVGANTQYKEIGYDSFEDYDYLGCAENEHFSFKNAGILGTAFRTTEEAHTGGSSYRVNANSNVSIRKQIKACQGANVSGLLAALLNHLVNKIQQTGSIPPGYVCPELLALQPYIYNPDNIPLGIYMNTSSLAPFGLITFTLYQDSANPYMPHIAYSYVGTLAHNGVSDVIIGTSYNYASYANIYITASELIVYGDNTQERFWLSHIMFGNSNCISCTSFAPNLAKQYWVSAWVKEKNPTANPISPAQIEAEQYTSYPNSKVNVAFEGIDFTILSTTDFVPTGEIIDGWQRIVGKVYVPNDATVMKFSLKNTTLNRVAYFDDVRMHPVNASLKTYAYDPVTLKLAAELDDNNYATFYEYDKEGALVRIKKETSKGVMTIKESRSSNPKVTVTQ